MAAESIVAAPEVDEREVVIQRGADGVTVGTEGVTKTDEDVDVTDTGNEVEVVTGVAAEDRVDAGRSGW